MDNYVEPIIINTDLIEAPQVSGNLDETRSKIYSQRVIENAPEASIFIFGYNRSEKTKLCVEYVLRYTTDVRYELILIDNGSTDDTYEYFQQVEHPNKKVVKITKNIGGVFAVQTCMRLFDGQYFVMLPNDVCVTQNWLSNLLKCYQSDSKIGFVTPMSSNISNYQDPELVFDTLDEMQRQAAIFNRSDPNKWQERLRLINIITVLSRDVMDLVGGFDLGFFHDFGEDDFSIRVKRAGYKLILCSDTFVHHNHKLVRDEGEDKNQFIKSLETGKQNFKSKYHGLDAWDDFTNFEPLLTSFIDKAHFSAPPCILGIDTRCGTPILEIRNKLRGHGIHKTYSHAFTTQAEYFHDLQCVCDDVQCDRIDFLLDHYTPETFDYILIGESINFYGKPLKILKEAYGFLKPGGRLLFKLRNSSDASNLLYTAGNLSVLGVEKPPVNIFLDDMHRFLKTLSPEKITVIYEQSPFGSEDLDEIRRWVEVLGQTADIDETFARITVKDYHFCLKK